MYKPIILLILLAQILLAAKTDTLSIFSNQMQKKLQAIVVIPDRASTDNRLPAVYLLHGYSGNFGDWSRHMDLEILADQYGMFLICPEGGYSGWYLDSPLQADSQYESHIIKEVIPAVEQEYPVLPIKSARAITGLSMGGHGALYLASAYPWLFGAAGSMSGAVDLRYSTKSWELDRILGTYEANPENWNKYSVTERIDELKHAQCELLIDCGVEDMFIGINRQLHRKLLEAGIKHSYIERPGGHSWDYWTNALAYHLLFFRNILYSRK